MKRPTFDDMRTSSGIRGVVILIIVVICVGCASAPAKQPADISGETTNTPRGWHTIVHKPAPDKPAIHTIDKFNPVWWFGNSDQPKPPESYRPDDKARLLEWRMRNPFHNFTFYVIGIADKEVIRSGCDPEHTFLPDGGWNFAVARSKWFPLPFVSWCHGKSGFHFYCGWRTAGNFGFKCNIE